MVVFLFQDLLLQMKERCGYMQEVNDLCKEVEKEAGSIKTSLSNGEKMNKIPELTEEEEENREDDEGNMDVLRNDSSSSSSSSDMDPKLIELAMEVKDLNARFATTCMQAKQHYASLSRVLTASIERHSSLRSSLRSSASTSSVKHSKRKDPSSKDSGSSPRRSRKLLGGNQEEQPKRKGKQVKGEDKSKANFDPPSTTEATEVCNPNAGTPDSSCAQQQFPGRKQGVVCIPEASVLAAESPSPARLRRSVSLSTSTDLDKELNSVAGSASSNSKVVLRSKIVNWEEYSDTQPRQKHRPKSALIIQANPASGTALLSEVQLRNEGNCKSSGSLRRRSVEVDYAALTRSGLISQGSVRRSFQSSPKSARVGNRKGYRNSVGSAPAFQPQDRSSIASIESLDPRAIMMLGGEMQQSDYYNRSFEASQASACSDITCSSTQIPDFVLEQGFGVWKGILGADNGLCGSKRSVSMDTLSVKKDKKGL